MTEPLVITEPGGRLVLPHGAPEEEWKAARLKGVTASEIAVVLGISPFDSPFNLYFKKLGLIDDDFDNETLSLGHHLEPWIADRWAADHPEFIANQTGLWASTARPWQMATPDRYLLERDGTEREHHDSVLEIKHSSTYDGWGTDGTDEIPAYYRAQVLWQLDTLGLGEAHVTCFFMSTRARRDYRVRYDVSDVDLMRKAATEFLERLEAQDPPPVDDHAATTSALKQLHPELDEDETAEIPADIAEAYTRSRALLKAAEDEAALAENRLRQAMGVAKRAESAGRKVASRSIYDRSGVDSKRLQRDYPDAYAACKTTSTVDRLNPARPKKEAA